MSKLTLLEHGFTLNGWVVEPLKNTISNESESKRLENRLMQTLVFMAKYPQQALSRQQFYDGVWQGRVVNEEALSRAISLLRTALGDDRRNPQFIQTIPGKGYRLVSEVQPGTGFKRGELEQHSIAVLPFVNLSDDEDNEYFSEGVSEEILNSLTQVRNFKVVGRTSSFVFKDQSRDLREVGQRLDVSHLLEGSVRKAGNRVRITAQLIKVADGFHLWSETFDRNIENIFEVQTEIAETVAAKLKVHMLGSSIVMAEVNPEIYSLYLQARYFLKPGQIESIKRALSLFHKVAEQAPDYAPAWVGVADACWYLISYDEIDKPWAMEVAERACEEALALDEFYAEAQLCRSLLKISFGQDWKIAQESMNIARELAPGTARVWLQAGNLASSMGDIEQAVVMLRKALPLDPLNTTCHVWLANALCALGYFDDAKQTVLQGLAISPERSILHLILGRIAFDEGDQEIGQSEMEQEPEGFWREYALTMAQCYTGIDGDDRLPDFIKQYSDAAPFQIAEFFAVRGDADSAFHWLNYSIDIKDNGITLLFVSTCFNSLRGDSRWSALVERRGLDD